jgi:hypothetical protein
VRADLKTAGILYVDASRAVADFHALRKTFGTLLMLAGVSEFVRMKLMRHSDLKLTQGAYTDVGMMPVWNAIAALPAMHDTKDDTEKDTEELVAESPSVSATVQLKMGKPILLAAGDEAFSPSKSASVINSPEMEDGARCRVRTCDFLREKQALLPLADRAIGRARYACKMAIPAETKAETGRRRFGHGTSLSDNGRA